MSFIDSHCHLDGPEYDADRTQVIERARAAGVTPLLNVGTGDPRSGAFERAVALADQDSEVYAAVGVHPHDAKLYDPEAEDRLITLVKTHRRVVAWGEVGLDYHYDHSPRDIQRAVFRRQLQVARTLNLPVIIHAREADDDTISILGETPWGDDRAGVMHCFGGSLEMARRAIDLGFFISFSGTLTFKKADDLRNTAEKLPLDRLMVETDCPYLSPVPYRGRRNEPAHVIETGRRLAEIHQKSIDEVARITNANFKRLFQIPAG
jgi:TatD DNase family protein